jgi:hypothetical protein
MPVSTGVTGALPAYLTRWAYGSGRSDSLRRMQNSLPSGSASVTQPVPGPCWSRRSWTRVAPAANSRSTYSFMVRSVGQRSKWTRFLTVLPAGSSMNSTR